MSDVASRLAVSNRTLQRRLQQEGTTFQKVLDELREELARHYLAAKGEVVVVERDEANDYLQTCRDAGAFIVIGDACDPAVVRKSRAAYAREAYMVTGDDGANFSALVHLADVKREDPKLGRQGQKVWLHLNAVDMCTFLRNESVIAGVRQEVSFEVVSLFEIAARNLVVEELIPLFPVSPEQRGRIHLVQVGFGFMGGTIVQCLAECAVTANRRRPRVSAVALDAKGALDRIRADAPALEKYCEIDPEPIVGNILTGNTWKEVLALVRQSREKGDIPVVCLATDSEYTNLTAALFLAEHFDEAGLGDVPVFFRLTESRGWNALARDLSAKTDGAYRQIKEFGAIPDICCKGGFTQEKRDRMAEEINRVYQERHGGAAAPSHAGWENLEWRFKNSNRSAADHVRVKLRTIGMDMVEDDSDTAVAPLQLDGQQLQTLAVMEHRRYCAEREIRNWKAGTETDYEKQVHAALVEWENLSEEERQKDFEQVKAIPRILHAGGYKPVPLHVGTEDCS
jgi:AraC-like DNA-binding protein